MTTQFLTVKNGRISYEVAGSGSLVVCMPSIGDLRAEYRFLAPQLVEAGFRVVQMDLRGLGESSTDWDDFSVAAVGSDLLATIHALGTGPAYVVGTSMAAGAGVWAAAEEPESLSGLVLIGPAVHGEVSKTSQLFYRALFARPWGPSLWTSYYKTLYPTHKPVDFDTYLTTLHSNLKKTGRMEAMVKSIFESKAASEARLPMVKAPVRIIMGSQDPDFKDPEAEARWVAEKLNGSFHMVQGAGHYPHAEMPEVTGGLVIDFLQSVERSVEGQHVA